MTSTEAAGEPVVLDASTLVDVLIGSDTAPAAKRRLASKVLHAPAHLDAEALSALGRLHRAGALTADDVSAALERVTVMPVTRHSLNGLITGAWERRGDLRLVDALYVELAAQLDTRVLTTDDRLARASELAEAVDGQQ